MDPHRLAAALTLTDRADWEERPPPTPPPPRRKKARRKGPAQEPPASLVAIFNEAGHRWARATFWGESQPGHAVGVRWRHERKAIFQRLQVRSARYIPAETLKAEIGRLRYEAAQAARRFLAAPPLAAPPPPPPGA